MYKNLSLGALGFQDELEAALALAAEHGFGGVEFDISRATAYADRHGAAALQRLFADAGVRPGHFGLPLEFRKDDELWQRGMALLPQRAALAAELGCLRAATWIMPGDNERPFQENRDFLLARLRPAAEILAAHGISLGLEFVGPKTLRDTLRHPFIHTMGGMLEFAAAFDTGNVGLLLDLYHLYTSHGTNEDVLALRPEQVVVVHVNDAVAGRAVDEQLDLERALPGETGVTDIAGFLAALDKIGYGGPVTVEPFSARLKALPVEQAVAETSAALDRSFAAAGL